MMSSAAKGKKTAATDPTTTATCNDTKRIPTHHELLSDLNNSNAYFDQLVDMIPTKLYATEYNPDTYNPKYFKGQAKESKETRRAKNKQAKRAKFDPSWSETMSLIKQRLEGGGGKPLTSQIEPVAVSPSSSFSSCAPVDGSDTGGGGSDDNIAYNRASKPKSNNSSSSLSSNRSRIEVLRERLHAKLAEKRGERPTDPNSISKRAARQMEKKKRKLEAMERNKKVMANAEKYYRGKSPYTVAIGNSGGGTNAEDLANVDHGRFAGLNNPIKTGNYSDVNKMLNNLSKTLNLEKMLVDAERKKQKLEELKKSDRKEDKKKAMNIEWGNIIKEATGNRVNDNPSKIKKAIKRKATKKQKSAKAWKTRLETTQQKMDERQKIRALNVNKRKLGGAGGANLSKNRIESESGSGSSDPNNVIDKKTVSMKGGGRRLSRAGFEGRKQDFLNKK